MRGLRPYLLLAAVVFLGVLVGTLPAALMARLVPQRVALSEVSGTLWDGAATVRLDGVLLGAGEWRLSPWSLIVGRAVADVALRHPDGRLAGRLTLHVNGTLDATALAFDLPLTTLHPAPTAPTWRGRIAGTVRDARLERGWPVTLDGQFTLSHLTAPGSGDDLGAFRLQFEPRDATPTALLGRLEDTGGPVAVRAQLRLAHDRTYRLDGDVTPRAGAPEGLVRAIGFLGTPGPDGRRPLAVTGTF